MRTGGCAQDQIGARFSPYPEPLALAVVRIVVEEIGLDRRIARQVLPHAGRRDVHRHVVHERQLDGQVGEQAVLGVRRREVRRVERVEDQLAGEQAAHGQRRDGRPRRQCGGRQEEEQRVVAQEVPVPYRAAAAGVGERHVDEQRDRGDHERAEQQPLEALACAPSRQQEQADGEDAWKEIRDEPGVTAHQEVHHVPRQHRRQRVAVEDDVGQQAVGGPHFAEPFERGIGRLERKRAVEGRSVGSAALVVVVSRAEQVHEEQAPGDDDECEADCGHAPPPPPQERKGQHRCRGQDVERLREGGDAQQRTGNDVRPRAAQQAAPAVGPRPRRHERRRDLLVGPEEEPQQHHREVEQLWREPDEVDGRGRREQEHERERQRRRHAGSRPHEGIRRAEARRQQQGVQHQEPVGAEQHDERRGREWIDERLAVVQPVTAAVGRLHEPDEWERALCLEVDVPPALEEDAFRPCRELLPDARQVLALELGVEVLREAVPEAVVGRLVALEAERHHRELHGQGEAEQQRTDDERGEHAGVVPRAARVRETRRVHRRRPPSRNDRSSVSIP